MRSKAIGAALERTLTLSQKKKVVMGSNRYWGLLSLALVGLLALGASASLFAIDLGGENLKVSVVKPGRTPISIVINEMSRRKTPALTGFINGERVMGEEAVTMMNRHPDKIFRRLRDMLGKRATDPDVAQMLRDDNLAYTLVEDPERGSIRLKLPDTGKEYSVEELMVRSLPRHCTPVFQVQFNPVGVAKHRGRRPLVSPVEKWRVCACTGVPGTLAELSGAMPPVANGS